MISLSYLAYLLTKLVLYGASQTVFDQRRKKPFPKHMACKAGFRWLATISNTWGVFLFIWITIHELSGSWFITVTRVES